MLACTWPLASDVRGQVSFRANAWNFKAKALALAETQGLGLGPLKPMHWPSLC